MLLLDWDVLDPWPPRYKRFPGALVTWSMFNSLGSANLKHTIFGLITLEMPPLEKEK